MRSTRFVTRWCAPALLVVSAGLASSVLAADLDPTTQAGWYAAQVPVVQVKGAPLPIGFLDSTVYVPFMLLGIDSFLNATLVENVNGNPVGYVTSFDVDPAAVGVNRTVTVLGTTDAASGIGVSNDVLVREMDSRSDSPGSILPDGTIAYMARFNNSQNNIDIFTGITGVSGAGTQLAEPIGAGLHPKGFLGLAATSPGVSGPSETGLAPNTADVLGAVFIGTPSVLRDPNFVTGVGTENDDLLIGHTAFNAFPAVTVVPPQFAASVNGVNVYRYNTANNGANPQSGTAGVSAGFPNGPDHVAGWTQGSVPLPINPGGETSGDARQTQPVLTAVTTPSGDEVVYVLHGIGFSGGTPFTGSSFNPMFLAVDTLRTDYASGQVNAEDNTIIIEADSVGGEGTQHGAPMGSGAGFADTDTTDVLQRFVDHGATGGAAEVSTTSLFDMNANGFVVALHENRNMDPTLHQVRMYSPLWNAALDRIVGFNLEKIITFNGDLDNLNNKLIPDVVLDTAGLPDFVEFSITPFSGTAIDDENRVAFSAITEVAQRVDDYDRDEDFLPPELATPQTSALLGVTTTLFVYDHDTDSLHAIIRGGGGDAGGGDPDLTDGTILTPLGGSPTGEQLMVGSFGFDQSTDGFCRDSSSRDARLLGISFRSSANVFEAGAETEFDRLNDFDGGDGTLPEGYTDRGGLLFVPGQLGNNERTARGSLIIRLGALILPHATTEGDGNGDCVVNFDDINAVLAGWNKNYIPGTGPGDADASNIVNFDDVNAVLGNWLDVCP